MSSVEKPADNPSAHLILASQSPARATLLRNAGLSFDAVPAAIDERAIEAEPGLQADAATRAAHLARAKALSVAAANPQAIVIGADQILVCGETVLHKPGTLEAARDQLAVLSGRTHSLVVAAALVAGNAVLWEATDRADLTMRATGRAERDRILAREGPGIVGSVGAYRLEGPSVQLFEAVQGDYFTVLGLPLLPLLAGLRQHAPHLFESTI